MQQLWSWRKALLVLAFTFVTLAALPTAHARPPFAHGAVVALQGTPHLWIADEQGTLHWGGDTRALAGKHVNWGDRTEVSLDRLRTLPVGDPWLSAGLLKDGDPIYLVKWESDWAQPRLRHIQSIADVELFGINDRNYGNFVLDKATWEARYGVPVVLATGEDVIALTPPSELDGWRYFQYETSLTRTASYPSSLGVGTSLLSGDVPVGDLIGTQRKYIVVIDHFLLYIQHLNFGSGAAYPFGDRSGDGTIDFEFAGDGIDFSQPRLRLSAAGDSSLPVPAVDRHWAFYHTDFQTGPASASFTLQADQPYRVLLAGEMEVGLSYVAFRWKLRSRSAASTPVGSNARASRSRVVRAMFIGRYRAVS